MKILANNKKAYHDYDIEETLEAGIVLKGTEIKSVRKGHCQLRDSYVQIRHGEAFVLGMHIAVYEQGNIFNHDPLRDRKLLLHRKEIRRLEKLVQQAGMTLVPTKVYFDKGSKAKVEIAVARGKKLYDKRQDLKERAIKRDLERAGKDY